MLVNLGHPAGRLLVERWYEAFMAIPDAVLAAMPDWSATGDDDQDLLQLVIRREPDIADAVLIADPDLLNSRHARFIRQHLRTDTRDLDRRIENIELEVGAAMADGPPRDAPALLDDRALHALRHQIHHAPPLVEAGPGTPGAAGIAAALGHWARRRPDAVPEHLRGLAEALDARDQDALFRLFAEFGRSPAALGQLGGPRQHERAAAEPGFARKRSLRTLDALLSLAEAVGVLDVESPDQGRWGFNAKLPPATLLAQVGAALGIDAGPPPAFGRHLGLEVGGRVLHLRMVEALHSAWRIRQWLALLGLDGVVEVGSGIGLRAGYAARLGLDRYHLLADASLSAVQACLLATDSAPGEVGPVADGDLPLAGLLFSEEALSELSADDAAALLRTARERGVRAVLSVDHEAVRPDGGRRAVRALVAAAGGFRPIHRGPHALRPGFVEEMFLAE